MNYQMPNQPFNQQPQNQPPAWMNNWDRPYTPQPAPTVPPAAAPVDGFPGRCINDVSDIRPNEVPLNGGLAVFPTNDLSTIYVKAWKSDGSIVTFRYAIDTEWQPSALGQVQQNDILKRLEALERAIQSKRSSKKEVDTNA